MSGEVAAALSGIELRDVDVAFSIVGFLFTAAFGALVWYDRRGRSYVDTNITGVVAGQKRTHDRLDALERRVGDIEDDMGRADVRLDADRGQDGHACDPRPARRHARTAWRPWRA